MNTTKMTKSSQKQKGFKVKSKKKVKVARPRMLPGEGLDAPARDFVRLLSDPCGAPLVGAPYGGVAGSNFYRFRNIIDPGSAAVDSSLQFCPSLVGISGAVGNGIGAIQWGSTNTTGSAPGNLYGTPLNNTIGTGIIGGLRCVGACIRVMYTGSELNRQGQVALNITASPLYNGLGTAAGVPQSLPTSPTLFQEMPNVSRLGEVIHEVKWVPGFNDQAFVAVAEVTSTQVYPQAGTAIVAAVLNAPPGSIQYEVLSCWEATPNLQGGGIVSTVAAPKSRNTLNDILRAIGNITDFAVRAGNIVVPGIRSGLELARQYGPALASLAL